jgi:hypothetical protein
VARELFVYWKLPRAAAGAAQAATATMQARLCAQHAGLAARLMRRADEAGDSVTLMETYARPPVGVGTELQHDIETAAASQLGAWCQGKRHVEVFEAFPG